MNRGSRSIPPGKRKKYDNPQGRGEVPDSESNFDGEKRGKGSCAKEEEIRTVKKRVTQRCYKGKEEMSERRKTFGK